MHVQVGTIDFNGREVRRNNYRAELTRGKASVIHKRLWRLEETGKEEILVWRSWDGKPMYGFGVFFFSLNVEAAVEQIGKCFLGTVEINALF